MKKEPSVSSEYAAAKALERRVWSLMGQGNPKQAVAECEQLTRQYPAFGSGWHTASQLATRLGNVPAALTAIESALSIDPQQVVWQLQRAMSLARLGRIEEMAVAVQELSIDDMTTAYQCSALAMLQTQLGLRESAVELYQKTIGLEPGEARHYYNVACLQRSLGDLAQAEENFDAAIQRNPDDYESWKIRSDLRRQTNARNHVDELEHLLKEGVEEDRGQVQVRYALAKELEDLGEAESSFKHLRAGSDLRRKLMQYDVARDLDTIEAIKRTFGEGTFNESSEGSDNSEPIFILGMPRTGTTLVERILASHSEVFSAGELNNFAAQLMTMIREQNIGERISRDAMVESSATLDFKKLGERYINSTRPFTGKSARFIDKMPLNYLYVGLIHLALPNATIINLQRDPMDTCYAIYKQLFVDAYPFSYSLAELGNYYVAYHSLMEHWRSVLPGVVYAVKYEELVNDLETETGKLLNTCGLDWQPQCLRFHENREASITASTAQIRRPVYKTSIGRWRDYSRELQPVADILDDAGIRYSN
jgi:tetratricopeptide (TPR) repeat protein